MGCSQHNIDLINKYFDEEITHAEEMTLKRHINDCNVCHIYFKEIKNALTQIKSCDKIKAPENFTSNVMAKLPKSKKKLHVRAWVLKHPIMTAAAMFLVFMVGGMFSFGTDNGELSFSKQSKLVVKDDVVIVPKGEVIKGDVIVKNGDIRIDGEVQGNVFIVNGQQHLSSAGHVSGEIEIIDQLFERIWFNIKDFATDLAPNK